MTTQTKKPGTNAWKLLNPGTLRLMSENMRRLSGVPAHLASDKAIRAYLAGKK